MADIEKGRIDRPRDEGVLVPRVESEKRDKPTFGDFSSPSTRRLLAATFLKTLDALVDAFSNKERDTLTGKTVSKQTVVETLQRFRTLLELLAVENVSHDSSFIQELSKTWIHLQEDYKNLEILERKDSKKAKQLFEVLESVSQYPLHTEHALGYYLSLQPGIDWMPFPFIDILNTLHEDAQKQGNASHLLRWVDKIEALSKNLRGKKPFSLDEGLT